MNTKRFQKTDINDVIAYVRDGKVIAFPTDTVYGLGVIYENEEALQALKVSKGRPENKPIPTMVSSLQQLERIAYLNENIRTLVNAFMPGAITLILKRKGSLPAYITNGFDTIGVRMPDDEFVLELIEGCGKPMLVTSANVTGEETGIVDTQVLSQLDGRIDGIVMGEASGKVASTIVDVSKGCVNIVREGPITKEMIEDALE